jgi:hypothetical protein
LFGVETERAYEGTVLSNRESSGDGFGGEVVAEARLVVEIVAGDRVIHVSRMLSQSVSELLLIQTLVLNFNMK